MIDKKEITIYRQYVKKGKMEGHAKETEFFIFQNKYKKIEIVLDIPTDGPRN